MAASTSMSRWREREEKGTKPGEVGKIGTEAEQGRRGAEEKAEAQKTSCQHAQRTNRPSVLSLPACQSIRRFHSPFPTSLSSPMSQSTPTAAPHADLMDSVYRFQRHIYDLTRKFYLLGRDAMIDRLALRPGDRAIEIGCGTARNLIRIARKYPQAELFGLDASEEMLKTARAKLARRGIRDRVRLIRLLAEQLDPRISFGLDRPFDACIFSYALSMIPTWQESLAAAIRSTRPGGTIHIVDFCDQGDLPRWFARLLKWWLSLFHVAHRPELLTHLQQLHDTGVVRMELRMIYRRYAYIAVLHVPERPPTT